MIPAGLIAPATIWLLASSPARPPAPRAGHTDILLVNDGAAVAIGSFSFGSGAIELPRRVFERQLEFTSDQLATGNDPGFNAIPAPPAPYQPLPGQVEASLHGHAPEWLGVNLLYWDGQGTPHFGPPVAGESLRTSMSTPVGPASEMIVSGAEGDVTGFSFATTDPDGSLHQHVTFSILSAGFPDATTGPPTAGVVLAPIRLELPPLALSPAVYLVLGHQVEDWQLEAARACLASKLELGCEATPDAAGCHVVGNTVACPDLVPTPPTQPPPAETEDTGLGDDDDGPETGDDDGAAGEGGGCAVAKRAPSLSALAWLIPLIAVARRRRAAGRCRRKPRASWLAGIVPVVLSSSCQEHTSGDDPADDSSDGVAEPCDRPIGMDQDGDGIDDACDRCPGSNDALDHDGDAVPDGCDACPGFDDALNGDLDVIPDGCDACPGFDDALDGDLDAVPDGCDACPGFDDALDGDLDTVPDGCDACPGSDDLKDDNQNGVPDGCEPCTIDYRFGHGDLHAHYAPPTGLHLEVYTDFGAPDATATLHPAQDICIIVPVSSYLDSVANGGRPQFTGMDPDPFEPMGMPAGAGFWYLSANNLGMLQPFWGISTEGVPPGIFDGPLQFEFVSFDMPANGQVSVYQLPFLPHFYISTSHPQLTETGANRFEMPVGGHDHHHWTFSAPGTYKIGVQVSGRRAADQAAVVSDVVQYHFIVEP
ncbi:MAG: hypothetical protein B7733_14740 [Myxococcales bacterium FL481]|nr:MAG: hypothetical protein B7733_14740 [Myxococcales bacterium FL481]